MKGRSLGAIWDVVQGVKASQRRHPCTGLDTSENPLLPHTPVLTFTAASPVRGKKWKEPKCPWTHEWIHTMEKLHVKEYCSHKKEGRTDACYSMDEPWKRSWSHTATSCRIPFIGNINRQIYRDRM